MKIDSILKAVVVLSAIALTLLLFGLSTSDLRGSTEPREAGVAAEMLQDGDYLMPRLNGVPFLEKPPLSYWLQSQSIRVFGYTNLAPRLPSVIAAIASVLLLFGYAARKHCDASDDDYHGYTTGLVAALILLTMASLWMNAREAGQDALLAFGVTLCLLSFHRAQESARPLSAWMGYSAGLCVATMAKGVIGLAIPGITIFAFLLIDTLCIERRVKLSRWLLPAQYAALALLPIATWLYLLYRQHGAGAVKEVIWINSVGRFAGEYTHGSHSEPFYYYLKKLPETFQPWTLPLFVALWQMRKIWRDNSKLARDYLLYTCWLIAPFILLSLSAGKRPPYLLSLYPAAAMLITLYVREYVQHSSSRVMSRLAVIQALLFTGIAIAITTRLFKLHVPLAAGTVGLLFVIALIQVWRSAVQANQSRFFAGAIAVMTIAYLGYGGLILPHDAVKDSARRMFDVLPRVDENPTGIILLNPNERVSGAARFYARGPVKTVLTAPELTTAWHENPHALVLLSARDAANIGAVSVREKFAYGNDEYWIVAKTNADL